MKRIILTLSVLMVIACNPVNKEQTPQDVAGTRQAINELVDQYHVALKAKDAVVMEPLLADNGLYCGTDPAETGNKSDFIEEMKQMAGITELVIRYDAGERKVVLSDDGQSAITLEQFVMEVISPVTLRFTTHAVKQEDGNWKLNFTSLSLVPENEDLGKINEVVMQKNENRQLSAEK